MLLLSSQAGVKGSSHGDRSNMLEGCLIALAQGNQTHTPGHVQVVCQHNGNKHHKAVVNL